MATADRLISTVADKSDGVVHIEAGGLSTNRAIVIKSGSNDGTTYEWIFELQGGPKPALLLQTVIRHPGQEPVFKNVCQFNFDGGIS